MAGRANVLTGRAITLGVTASTTWTAPASDLRVMLTALGDLGHEVQGLIDAAQLTSMNLEDPDVRVPCDVYGVILACAQQRRFTPNLALELARRTPIGAYPLLDYLIVTCDTVGAGIRQLARYFRITTNPTVLDIRPDADPIEVRVSGPSAFAVEYFVSLMALHLHEETNGQFVFATVMFRHEPDDAAAMARTLGCPVLTRQSWGGAAITQACWTLPLRRREPALRKVLETHANEILARLPTGMGFAIDVQRVLSARIGGGDTRIATVARELTLSARSLQRRLTAEGVTYHELLDEARKEASARYMEDSALSLAEIAYLVGYSEPAPFHRAFKRWYGVTPDTFRHHGRP
jgi:AraC-like DNA-binding protein